MQDTIKVHVVKYKNRPNLVMRYVDPLTGKQVARSAKTARKRDAERAAAKWEKELHEGTYQKASRMSWADFREKYEQEKLAQLSPRTLESWSASANHFEREIGPAFIARIDTAVVSEFQRKLRAGGMRSTTIASHLRNLRAAFRWAAKIGLMQRAPVVDMPKAIKGDKVMRGRPVTGEEFERMLAKVPHVRRVGIIQRADRSDIDRDKRNADVDKWRRLLRGLYLSGLRLGEALQLSWNADAAIAVVVTDDAAMLRFYGEAQKSKRDQLLPVSPEFEEFLLATPPSERHGLVFGIEGLVRGRPMDTQRASRVIAAIGEAAGVVIDANDLRPRAITVVDEQTGKETTKTVMVPRYATAHDLRRAFGTRWSRKVMPATLQKLMRHAAIETTLKHYVQHNANDIRSELRRAVGITVGSVDQKAQENAPADAEAQLT